MGQGRQKFPKRDAMRRCACVGVFVCVCMCVSLAGQDCCLKTGSSVGVADHYQWRTRGLFNDSGGKDPDDAATEYR